MKRTFIILAAILFICYGYKGWQIYRGISPFVYLQEGVLSDIAERVIPVFLDTREIPAILNPSKIKRSGEFLYLVNDYVLYCFTKEGQLVSRLTTPEDIMVADYLIDEEAGQLIVLGNEDDVYYYTPEGELIRKKKFPREQAYCRIRNVAIYADRIWVVEEISRGEGDIIEKVVVEYDTAFVKQNLHTLGTFNSRSDELSTCRDLLFSIIPDSGELYVYGRAWNPQSLLQDTISIRGQHQLLRKKEDLADIQIYPVRLGHRFAISSSVIADGLHENYFFCYDHLNNICWDLKEGFEDDLYSSGAITEFYPMDLTGQTYWYIRSAEQLVGSFSGKDNHHTGPVLFIVELKS